MHRIRKNYWGLKQSTKRTWKVKDNSKQYRDVTIKLLITKTKWLKLQFIKLDITIIIRRNNLLEKIIWGIETIISISLNRT